MKRSSRTYLCPLGSMARAALTVAALAAMLWSATTARADLYAKRHDIQTLVRDADVILVGKVKTRESTFEGGVVVTRYKVAVSEYLKGDLGSTVDLALPGGVVEEPLPIRHRVGDTPSLFKGEKAMMFLSLRNQSQEMRQFRQRRAESRAQQADAQPPRLADDHDLKISPQFVGLWQGRFAIVKDETGQELAVQVPPHTMGLAHGENSLATFKHLKELMDARTTKLDSTDDGGETSEEQKEEELLNEFLSPKATRTRPLLLKQLKQDVKIFLQKEKQSEKG